MLEHLASNPSVSSNGKSRRWVVLGVTDVVLALALGTVALLLRLNAPTDGLFYDDAWVVLGVTKGSLWDFVTIAQSQPGFTLLLMVWKFVFGTSTTSMVAPAVIAGALGPAVLYVLLRGLDYARSIALLLGAMLVVSTAHIDYSPRAKSYTADVLIVLVLAGVVPRLARRPWKVRTAAIWFAASVFVGFFSSAALVATGAAGLILVLHAHADRRLRVVTVAAQFLTYAVGVSIQGRTYNEQGLRAFFGDTDAYIHFDSNPVHFVRDSIVHVVRIAYVFPGGPRGLSPVCIAVALVALSVTAWRGSRAISARYLLLVFGLAFVGGVLGRIPFGSTRAGYRVELWLIPVLAFGLAAGLQYARDAFARHGAASALFDVLVVGTAVVFLVSAIDVARVYPPGGVRTASRQVMAELGPNDVVWVTYPTMYSFALYSGSPVGLRATPQRLIGFMPRFDDQRVHIFEFSIPSPEFGESVRSAERVFVVHANFPLPVYGKYRLGFAIALALSGFKRTSWKSVGTAAVEEWQRT